MGRDSSRDDPDEQDMVPVDHIMRGEIPEWVPDRVKARQAGKFCAIDCEMVGAGVKGTKSMLARVSIVNVHGVTLYDKFVAPTDPVTDYRTWVSGITKKDLIGAPSFDKVQDEVVELLRGRVLVGHAIENDLDALNISADAPDIRDTARYAPFHRLMQTKKVSLRRLAKAVLGKDIQGAEHDSIVDARVTMALFRTQHDPWEAYMRRKIPPRLDCRLTHTLRRIRDETGVSSQHGEPVLPKQGDPSFETLRDLWEIGPKTQPPWIVKRQERQEHLARKRVLESLGMGANGGSAVEAMHVDSVQDMAVDGVSGGRGATVERDVTMKRDAAVERDVTMERDAAVESDPLSRLIQDISGSSLDMNIVNMPAAKAAPRPRQRGASVTGQSGEAKEAKKAKNKTAKAPKQSTPRAARAPSTDGWWQSL